MNGNNILLAYSIGAIISGIIILYVYFETRKTRR